MSGECDSDVNLVWNSLKDGGAISPGTGGIASFVKRHARRRHGNSSQGFDFEGLCRPFDINAVSGNDIRARRNIHTAKDEEKRREGSVSDPFCGLSIEDATLVRPVNGDSDDEDDPAKENVPSQHASTTSNKYMI